MSLVNALGHELGASPMSQVKPIVFVVDDDISVREALELLIRCAGWQPETFESAQEFLEHPPALVPNCLVLDISLPGLNGLELQNRVTARRADMPIIFITGDADVRKSVKAMKAGAVDFLTKPVMDEMLLSAIRDALERSRVSLHREAEIRALRHCFASLTRRERQVMALVVLGLLNKEVGSELGISESTVKVYRGLAMQKMKAGTFAELVKMGARLGLGRGRVAQNPAPAAA